MRIITIKTYLATRKILNVLKNDDISNTAMLEKEQFENIITKQYLNNAVFLSNYRTRPLIV